MNSLGNFNWTYGNANTIRWRYGRLLDGIGHSKSKSTRVAVIGASAACKRSVPSHRRASPWPSPVCPCSLTLTITIQFAVSAWECQLAPYRKQQSFTAYLCFRLFLICIRRLSGSMSASTRSIDFALESGRCAWKIFHQGAENTWDQHW